MTKLKSIEQVLRENGTPVYAVFPSTEWEHYDEERCPRPIREWIEQHYPDVAIVRLSGFSGEYLGPTSIKNPNGLLSDLLPCPVFLLGFNDEQAAHFSEDWRKPGAPSDFYFVICERQSTIVEKEDADYYIPVF